MLVCLFWDALVCHIFHHHIFVPGGSLSNGNGSSPTGRQCAFRRNTAEDSAIDMALRAVPLPDGLMTRLGLLVYTMPEDAAGPGRLARLLTGHGDRSILCRRQLGEVRKHRCPKKWTCPPLPPVAGSIEAIQPLKWSWGGLCNGRNWILHAHGRRPGLPIDVSRRAPRSRLTAALLLSVSATAATPEHRPRSRTSARVSRWLEAARAE